MRMIRFALILLAMGFATSAPAQMMGKQLMGEGMQGGQSMSMGMDVCPMCTMGDQFGAICHVELGAFGLPVGAVKALEDDRFALRKTVIRKKADLQILHLELHRMVEDKAFDLSAAQKKVQAIAVTAAEIRGAHLEFLHAMASKLTDEQWQNLHQEKMEMMPIMGGRGMMQGMMHGGQQGGLMEGGMMMRPGDHGGGAGHHPEASTEAEQFFKKE